MLYNSNIEYNQSGLSYIGTIIINVLGLDSPIILSNLTVSVGISQDYSNNTTIAVISYNIEPEGILIVEATAAQASALIQSVATSATGTAEITLAVS